MVGLVSEAGTHAGDDAHDGANEVGKQVPGLHGHPGGRGKEPDEHTSEDAPRERLWWVGAESARYSTRDASGRRKSAPYLQGSALPGRLGGSSSKDDLAVLSARENAEGRGAGGSHGAGASDDIGAERLELGTRGEIAAPGGDRGRAGLRPLARDAGPAGADDLLDAGNGGRHLCARLAGKGELVDSRANPVDIGFPRSRQGLLPPAPLRPAPTTRSEGTGVPPDCSRERREGGSAPCRRRA